MQDVTLAFVPMVDDNGGKVVANAATDKDCDYQLCSADESSDPKFTNAELPDACLALTLKLQRDKHGHRQYGRRLKSESFKLSASQKVLMASSYRAARNDDRLVDYERMSESRHFNTFKNNAQKLRALEKPLLREIKVAIREQQQLDAGNIAKTTNDWEEELARCHVLHQRESAEIQTQ
ncbi:hypothetical protein PHYPSEUDO_014624, partial [Phytophthora pseudosyringae]